MMRKKWPVFINILLIIPLIGILSCKKKPKKIDIAATRIIKTEKPIALKVTHISPTGSVEGYRETFKILVGFNQAMVPLQAIPRGETRGPLEFEPAIKGKYRWMGSRTLAFIPDDTLQTATKFTVTLRKDKIKSLTGMRLKRDTSWTFESVRPAILSSSPYHGSKFVDIKNSIYLKFNMPMDPGRVGDKIRIIAVHGQPSYVYCGHVAPKESGHEQDIHFDIRNLKDYEKEDWPLKRWKNDNTLVLVPREDLPRESKIQVSVNPGLLPAKGNLGMPSSKTVRFNTFNFFTLLNHSDSVSGDDPIKLCFSNRVNIKELVKHIQFNPPVEIPEDYKEASWGGTSISLYLPFDLNTNYRVEISKDLQDIFENKLDRDYSFVFKVGDYLPHAAIPTGVNLLESIGRRMFPATFVNVDSVHLSMGIIPLDQAVTFLQKNGIFSCYRSYYSPGLYSVERWWRVNSYKKNRNKKIRLPIKLDQVLRGRNSGLVFLEMDNLGQNRYSYRCRYPKAFIQVGNLGVTWKYSPENNLVWVSRLDDTDPVQSARVQLRTNKNQILWQGYTDIFGLCEFPGWAELGIPSQRRTREYQSEYEMHRYSYRYEPDFWLTVSKGNDQAVYSKNWDFGIDRWRFDIPYRWSPPAYEYKMFIFTEKGLYKSGETVHIKGILREKRKGKWVLPKLDDVKFVVRDSRDEEIVNEYITLNNLGSFIEDIELGPDAPTGLYRVAVELPKLDRTFSRYFRVEAYRPAEFEVKVTAERDTFVADETFEARVMGRYLFGMPMVDAPASWSLYRDYLYLSYPQHRGYSFGWYQGSRGRSVIGSGHGKLDDRGELDVKVKLEREDIYVPSVLTLEGTVTSPNRRSLSGRQNWPVFNANILVGLKASEYLYVLGDTTKISFIAVRPSGEKLDNQKVNLKIVKREWKSIKKARVGGRYEWVSELVEDEIVEKDLNSRNDSTVFDWIPEKPGYYYVHATTKDGRGRESASRAYFYVAGRGYVGWKMRDDDIIELVPDKDLYDVGDTAKILIKSPYDSANALITLERELVLRKWTTKIHGNAAYIEVPIKSIDLPNIYVCVMLFRGRTDESWDEEKEKDLGKPQFKIGYANLKVDSKEKHLKVRTWSDMESYRPRDSVTVFFNVKDYEGHPVRNCEVALFVVDVGVLNLIGFVTPNPFHYFYGSRSLFVKTIESRLQIIGERNYGEKGEERGGGGAAAEARDGVSYREKFIATVFYRGNIKTDNKGNGKVKFALVDNLTKFRIMAVAQTKNSEFGSADSVFVVNLPFIVTPSIPRVARVGDEFKAGVVLHNRTEKENIAKVECLVEGLITDEELNKEVTIPPNGSREIRFSFKAEKEGEAVFKFKAQMGKEQDALKLTIPVINPPFIEAVATFSSTNDSVLEAVMIPDNIYSGIGGLEFLLSSSILAGMERGIEHLLDYPYGCLEQRLSRILPLIVGEEIINQFNLAPVTGKALRDSVQKVIDDVPQYQLYSGGFVFFKGSVYPSPYLSAYTMYILRRARESGYKIDMEVVRRGKSYLRKILNLSYGVRIDTVVKGGKSFYKEVLVEDDSDWSYPYNYYAKLTTKAFCVYSLAIWGERPTSYASRLFEFRDQLPIFGKTLLLKAGRKLRMGRKFEKELARMILNKVKLSPTTAHFEESENRGWTFPSPAKVTGYVIQTFTELDLDFPYKDQTIRWLVRERTKKSLPTTHENAFVFDAFQTYYKKYEKEEPDFVTRIIVDEKEILKHTFKGRTNKPPEKFEFSLDEMKKNKMLPVKIVKDGSGRLYYVMRMQYALKEHSIAFDEGFYVWKEISTLDDKKVGKFKRGNVYKVVLHIVVPETRLFAVVDDPLPAGFVPVQTSFATEARAVREQYWQSRWRERGHWWGGFDHRERYNDKMLFFAQRLFPGEHTLVYFIRAATSGKFLAPSTKAEEMYSPEVFGSTGQKYVEVE